MDHYSENKLKKLCCTCLSKERKLFQLCRLYDGVNNLYLLLSYDSEAYREGFYKDTASLFICWECRAIMQKISRFRRQACVAQKQLTEIIDGRTDIKSLNSCLSRLSEYHTASYETIILDCSEAITDNFIDCGSPKEIKSESDDDIPLSELYTSDHDPDLKINPTEPIDFVENLSKASKPGNFKKKTKFKNGRKNEDLKKFFSTLIMNEGELIESRVKRKMAAEYVDSEFKCDSCIEVFKNEVDLDNHNATLHLEKDNTIQCDVCQVYTNSIYLQDHRQLHYEKHKCNLCDCISYKLEDIFKHMKKEHYKNYIGHRKKSQKGEIVNPGSKPRRNQSMMDKRTPYGYLCTECNKCFDNKNQRWKHVQRHHREGYKCSTCGKRFAFKNNLSRHEQLHKAPPPREECQVCHKMIRVDLLKIHARIHSAREQFRCSACDKCFVSRASYEHHLKYTQAHAATDILKYKCSTCDKGYRSRGELRDHVNYQHMGKTHHKCPVCGKALATRRCITRHVRRAHDGVKESPRDKICQQCGKAFRDKKGLREHEFIHTGERPLACELCGGTFRQSASLYTHRKRVHNLHPQKKTVQVCYTDVAS